MKIGLAAIEIEIGSFRKDSVADTVRPNELIQKLKFVSHIVIAVVIVNEYGWFHIWQIAMMSPRRWIIGG